MADGLDWNRILEVVAPVAGSLAAHGAGGSSGFQQGFLHGQQLAKEERAQRAQADQNRSKYAGDYALHVLDQLNGLDNPEEFAALRDLAAAHAPDETTRAQIKAQTLPANRLAPATRQELHDAVQTYLDLFNGDASQAAQAGGSIHLSRANRSFAIPDALALTLPAVQDASGQQKFLTTPKVEKVGGTEEERFTQKWAKDRGKKAADLSAAEELQARKAFRDAGKTAAAGSFDDYLQRYASEQGLASDALSTTQIETARKRYQTADRNPQIDDLNMSLKQLQLENERRKAKDASTSVADIVPGSREYKVAEDLAAGRITFQQLRTLYAYSRDVNKKLAIYDKAAELNPNFSPAAFEMGYKFASSPKVQAQLSSLNNVMSGVPDLVKASDAASRVGSTSLNSFIVPGGIAIGNRKYSDFKTAQIAFADELSGALGYGSATDMSREMGFNMANPNLSPANFRSAIETVVVPFVQRKKASMLGSMGPYGNADLNSSAANPPTTAAPESDVIYARDERGALHKAKKGTPLPHGWTVERR